MRIAGTLFALFTLGHIIRLINATTVTFGGRELPMGISVVALIVGLVMSVWLFRLSARK